MAEHRLTKLLVLQHEPGVSPGAIAGWARNQDIDLDIREVWNGELPPIPNQNTGIIVLGGSMNVGEEHLHPWMDDEYAFLERLIAGSHQTLGICLGAQMLAHVLGAKTGPAAYKERGWHEVELTEVGRRHAAFAMWPDRQLVFQSHGQTFGIPEGCELLACSDAVDNQAFGRGSTLLGVQFHPEFTQDQVHELYGEKPTIWQGEYVQEYAEFSAHPERFVEAHRALDRLLTGFFTSQP